MYLKTIWNPGDIITTEKWNNIINNLHQQYVYIIPYDNNGIGITYNELLQKMSQYGNSNCLLIEYGQVENSSDERYTFWYPFEVGKNFETLRRVIHFRAITASSVTMSLSENEDGTLSVDPGR